MPPSPFDVDSRVRRPARTFAMNPRHPPYPPLRPLEQIIDYPVKVGLDYPPPRLLCGRGLIDLHGA